jgi:hypothetical protein
VDQKVGRTSSESEFFFRSRCYRAIWTDGLFCGQYHLQRSDIAASVDTLSSRSQARPLIMRHVIVF